MTWQRKRNGRWALFYPTHVVTDARGNEVTEIHPTAPPVRVRFSEDFQRSNRAELPGEQGVSIFRIRIDHKVEVHLGMRIHIPDDDTWWDVYAPPAYRHGTRHVRHQSVELRQRPDHGGL